MVREPKKSKRGTGTTVMGKLEAEETSMVREYAASGGYTVSSSINTLVGLGYESWKKNGGNGVGKPLSEEPPAGVAAKKGSK